MDFLETNAAEAGVGGLSTTGKPMFAVEYSPYRDSRPEKDIALGIIAEKEKERRALLKAVRAVSKRLGVAHAFAWDSETMDAIGVPLSRRGSDFWIRLGDVYVAYHCQDYAWHGGRVGGSYLRGGAPNDANREMRLNWEPSDEQAPEVLVNVYEALKSQEQALAAYEAADAVAMKEAPQNDEGWGTLIAAGAVMLGRCVHNTARPNVSAWSETWEWYLFDPRDTSVVPVGTTGFRPGCLWGRIAVPERYRKILALRGGWNFHKPFLQ